MERFLTLIEHILLEVFGFDTKENDKVLIQITSHGIAQNKAEADRDNKKVNWDDLFAIYLDVAPVIAKAYRKGKFTTNEFVIYSVKYNQACVFTLGQTNYKQEKDIPPKPNKILLTAITVLPNGNKAPKETTTLVIIPPEFPIVPLRYLTRNDYLKQKS